MLDIFVYYTPPWFLPNQHIGFQLIESIYKESGNLFIEMQLHQVIYQDSEAQMGVIKLC